MEICLPDVREHYWLYYVDPDYHVGKFSSGDLVIIVINENISYNHCPY